ncbi:HIT domain-containing protein [Cellvibrio japonicus]|uniref:Histidine triad family protein n=1 Tax=Cellvibrio japonicus (strain Ueda107) TaxID=498211 RepID=B3PKJ8_CELJU|nr:HIT domain-containing protein [Cellvibrio japonicus]ACE86083.1 histidine triad family protein [Cellvibrio japonicus Ueda107]QEI12860.1 HIT domain-containing protein [Cellvibrio japonicus]QEI16434.1 HIT domain-containing protein [Cellvibrio japonicus]QEI20012.1 HIT domain-containing protein [Cellvibrio japonicus]
MFELHPRLAEDSVVIGEFDLSLLLLSKDANYPWCILVPRREDIYEIHHLDEVDQLQLIRESCRLAEVMTSLFDADKMNVAALGNVVRQLHVHHIARFTDDPAWPQPIWGRLPFKVYESDVFADRIRRLQNALVGEGFTPL